MKTILAVALLLSAAALASEPVRPRRTGAARVQPRRPSHVSAPTRRDGATRAQPGQPSSVGAPTRRDGATLRYSPSSHWAARSFAPSGSMATSSRRSSRPLRRAGEEQPPSGETAPTPVFGALLRTEGLGFRLSDPTSPPRMHAVDAGERIALQDNKAVLLTNSPGAFTGPKDKLPAPNPVAGGGQASGRNAITELPGGN